MADLVLPTKDDIDRLKVRAWDYAKRSCEYTKDYPGWKPEDQGAVEKKKKRIGIGKTGQLWLKRVCELNQVPFIDDVSDHKTPDNYDVIIYHHTFDVKTTSNGFIPGQVNAALQSRQIDYYCFLNFFNQSGSCGIAPYGVISHSDFWEQSTFIPHNEQLPGTNLRNKFKNGSNVLEDLSLLDDLGDMLIRLRNKALIDVFRPEMEKIVNERIATILDSLIKLLDKREAIL